MERHCVTDSRSSSPDFSVPVEISREQFMELLLNVQSMLLRATYSPNQLSTSIKEISLERAVPSGSSGTKASLVEHCDCRAGYTGMSCEECDSGYERRPSSSSLYPRGECLRTEVSRCNTDGTLRDDNGRCTCKPFVTGPRCDQCIAQTFHLNQYSAGGCAECFCMGVTRDCASTSWRRELVSVSNRLSDGWTLADNSGDALPDSSSAVTANGNEVIADLRRIGRGSFYWKLPAQFSGNMLGAYGGKLRFNTNFIAASVDRPNTDKDIILFGGTGIQITADFTNIVLDNREYRAEIPLLEGSFRRADGVVVNREHMLMALADVQYLLIKASFTPDTVEARISQVTIDVAAERETRGARAYEVEECNCPPGYEGLSCETCSQGYTRDAGVYLGICTRCDCNGHADECNSDTGFCVNCLHGTTGRYCERCTPGYERNANSGSPFDCVRPTTLVTIAEPSITVTIGGRAELVCGPYNPDLPYSDIIWRRVDGQPLPRTASVVSPGRLVITNVQSRYAGDYRCTITTRGGIIGNAIASLVIISGSRCPTGYDNPPDCNLCARGFTFNNRGRCEQQRPTDTIVVSISPPSVVVNEGDSIQITCTARSQVDNSVYVVAWQLEGGRLPLRARDTNGELYIPRATERDAGVYICTGSNLFERKSARVTVTVRPFRPNPPKPEPTKPAILTVSIEPAKLYVAEGRSRAIQCRVTGSARSVTWRKSRDAPIASKNQISTTVLRDDTLTFVNFDVNDRGYYYCTAIGADAVTRVESNAALVDFQRTFISVGNTNVRVIEGATARLECRADNSVTVSSIVWTRDGSGRMDSRYSQSNGILVIPSAIGSDTGIFTCTITTTSGVVQRESARLTVERVVRPTVNPEVRIIGGHQGTKSYRVGDSISFRCELASGPRNTDIYWQFSGGSWPSNVQNSGSSLYIASAAEENSGRYTCVGEAAGRYGYQAVSIAVTRQTFVINLPDKYDAPINTRVELTCSVPASSGSVQPTVYWRSDRGQRLTESSTSQATMVIESVQMYHAGNYTCVAEVPGASSSKTLRLNVIPDRSGVIYWPQNPIVVRERIGGIVSLDCKPTTSLPTSTSWRRENSANLPNGAVQRGTRLEFRNLRLTDAGTYTCTARNSLGSADLYATLFVEGPPGQPVMSANQQTLSSNGVKTYQSGDLVTLTCLAEGSPAPQYIWSRMLSQGGFTRIRDGGNTRINDGMLSKGSELVISRIEKADEGYYNCTAYNSLGSSEVFARLTVSPGRGNDGLVPSNVNVRGSGDGNLRNMYKTGQTAVLRCVATSGTPMSYRWTFSNGALPRNAVPRSAVLVIEPLGPENQGTYYCTVTNSAGSSRPASAQVFISGSDGSNNRRSTPLAPVPPRSTHTSPSGGIVSLQCPLSDGADRIVWTRDGGKALPASARYSNNNQLLEFFDVRTQDEGVYYCSAVNSVGSSPLVPITVYITSRGSLPSLSLAAGAPAVQRVSEGASVDMSCIASGPDTTIKWSREDGKAVNPSRSGRLGDNTLRLMNVQEEDAGVYICQATNSYGQSEPLRHTLQVARRNSVRPPTITADSSVNLGGTIDLRCQSSEPDATFVWSRLDGEDIPANSGAVAGFLRISSFRAVDAGVYVCSVASSAGSSSSQHRISLQSARPITLQIDPIGKRPNPEKFNQYAEDSQLELNCLASNRQAKITWSRPGDNLPYSAYQNGSALVFKKLEEIDRGRYRCVATFGGSEISADYSFDVIYVPSGKPVSSVSISVAPTNLLAEGSTVMMRCTADGDGVYYEWRRGVGSLTSKASIEDGLLTITNFEREDEGTYICTASNLYGSSKTTNTRVILDPTLLNL